MNNSIPETQAIAGIRLTSPYSQVAVVSPWDFPMACTYEYDEGEAPIFWPTEQAHPGSPATVSLLSCNVGGVEIYDMLSPSQVETVEDAILSQLES